jgi:ABC-type transporter Mla subunit MlaD
MPTKKELLAGLLQEAEELGESLDTTAEASSKLRAGLESLRSDIASASERLRR